MASTGEDLSSLLSNGAVSLVEGDDQTLPANVILDDLLADTADLLGFEIKILSHHRDGNEFCKYTAKVSADGSIHPAKSFSSTFFKHGWTVHHNFKTGSWRDSLLA